jgi:shikimate kinase
MEHSDQCYYEEYKMKDKVIEELHRIREELYERTKDLPFEERLKQINQGVAEFQKRIDRARKERENSAGIS